MARAAAANLVLGTVRCGRAGLLRSTALQAAGLAVFVSQAAAQPAPNARPQGGQVVAGAASIGQTATKTSINQASQRAAIDWRSFDVGRDQTVQFNQPNASAVALNRVTGPDPSSIAGRISANGQLVITNQSGVMFHKGAQVDAAGLVVSAPGISNHNFMNGRMVFDGPVSPDAQVSNAGSITVKQAGLAALVAPRVVNSGVINARMGRVVLAGAEAHTVDLYGDGLLSIDVTRQVRQAPRGADGQPVAALVTNTGTVIADGGVVRITAAAADGIVQNLVEAGGRIQANTLDGRSGSIAIAGVGGSVRIEGRVAADGAGAGGQVALTATGALTVANTARISADGGAGGGIVAVGATIARAASPALRGQPTTASTTVEPGARISANARLRGNGGQVTVLSGGKTVMEGTVSARGGSQSGDGGKVELSGQTLGRLGGSVSTAAPKGRNGRILIDPGDLTISNSGGPDTVAPATLEAMSGDVTVHADNDLIAAASVTLTGSGQSLFLDAGNAVTVNLGVTLTAPGSISVNAGAGGISLQGSLRSLSTTPYVRFQQNSTASLGLVLTTTGAITQGPSSTLFGSALTGQAASASLTSTLNQIPSVGNEGRRFTTTSGDFSLVDNVNIAVGAGSPGGGITVAAGRTVSLTTDGLTVATSGPSSVPGGNSIITGGGTLAVQPLTPGRGVQIATNGVKDAAQLSLTTNELGSVDFATLSLGSATAGPVTLGNSAATLDLGSTRRLQVASAGTVQTGGGATLGVGTLGGTAAALNLADDNVVPTLDGFAASGSVNLHTGGSLHVTAPVSGSSVFLSASGPAGVPAGELRISADITTAGTLRLDTTNGTAGAALPIVQDGGVITAGTLTGAAGSVSLPRPNQIAQVSDFSAEQGFAITDARGLALTGTLQVGTTLDVEIGGALTQSGGRVAAATLTGTATSIALPLPTNAIFALRDLSTSVGDLQLASTLTPNPLSGAPRPLTAAGAIIAPSGRTITLQADQFALARSGSIAAPAGSVGFRPLTPGGAIELVAGAQSTDRLSINQAIVNGITTGTLSLGGGATGSGVVIGRPGDTVTLTGHADSLLLLDAGPITEGAGARLVVNRLVAGVVGAISASSIALDGPNGIGALDGAVATGPVSVTNAGPLVARDLVSGAAVTVNVTGTLQIAGSQGTGDAVSAPTVNLNASGDLLFTPGLILPGNTVRATNALNVTVGGAFNQTGGGVITDLLTGTAGSVSLPSAGNLVARVGPFTTTTGFQLTDGRSLTVVGPLNLPDAALNVAGDLAINSGITGNTANLVATGAIAEGPAGLVRAATLTGSATSAQFSGLNRITTLGGFTTTAGFSLLSGGDLQVAGPLTDNLSANIEAGANLSVPGSITAPTVTLRTGSSAFGVFAGETFNFAQTGGTIAAPTLLTLQVPGQILQTGGRITAGTLTGSSGETTALTSATNAIATLGPFTSAGGFALRNGQGLTQSGALADTLRIGLNVAGPLALTGTLNAPTVDLVATGAVTQPSGTITAATLTGNVGSAALAQPLNAITNLGAITSAGDFSLADSVTLNVSGPAAVGAGQTLSLASNSIQLQPGGSLAAPGGTVALAPLSPGTPFALGSFVPGGSITATTLRVGSPTAGTITIGGAFNLPGITTLDLQSGAAIVESPGASLQVARLTGRATGATLDGANRIGTLAGFTTSTGFLLTNAQALTVAGPLLDGTGITLNVAGNLALQGNLTAPTLTLLPTGALTQTAGLIDTGLLTGSAASASLPSAANRIATLGRFSSGAGFQLNNGGTAGLGVVGPVSDDVSVRLATSGPLQLQGDLTAPAMDLRAAGPITQPAGRIATAALTGSAGAIALTQAANQIDAVGDLSSTGAIALTDGRTLTVGGPISAGPAASLTLTTDRLQFAPAGRLAAQAVLLQALTPGGGFTLGANTLGANTGLGGSPAVFADTLTVGAATGGPITVDGGFNLANVRLLRLLSAGAIAETSGSAILVPTITGSGGSVDLGGPNGFAAVDGLTATQGGLSLTNAAPLLVGGTVQARDAVLLAVGGGGTLTLNGTIVAPTVSLAAAAVVQPAGGIQAATLRGDVGTATLGGANAIDTLGRFNATSLALTDTTALVVAGPVTTRSLVLNGAGNVQFTGTVATGLLQVDAGGTITQTSGALTAETLTGSAVRLASFGSLDGTGSLGGTGTAAIGTLGAMTLTGSTLLLADTQALTVTGPVTAGSITLVAPDQITLQGGTMRSDNATITVLAGQGGAGQLLQTGTTTVTPLGANDGVLSLTVPSAGQIVLNDLAAPSVNVGLVLGAGTATGALTAANLQVNGTGGSADLTGQVAGRTGFDAAAVSTIKPQVDLAYTLNGCAIASATCGAVVPPIMAEPTFIPPTVRLALPAGLPATEPVFLVLSELTPKSFLDTLLGNVLKTNIFTTDLITLAIVRDAADPELVLPNISDRDY